jgi:CCAAT-binding transcription factor (CBF-B/NF-YA) subunit B
MDEHAYGSEAAAAAEQQQDEEADYEEVGEQEEAAVAAAIPEMTPAQFLQLQQSMMTQMAQMYAHVCAQVATGGAPAMVMAPFMFPGLQMQGAAAAGSADNGPPLQQEAAEEHPTYVNAKQYRRILKRRDARAKLEERKRVPTGRRNYLHKSRHDHACRRMRGPGGRFMTKEELAVVRARMQIEDPEGAAPGTANEPAPQRHTAAATSAGAIAALGAPIATISSWQLPPTAADYSAANAVVSMGNGSSSSNSTEKQSAA